LQAKIDDGIIIRQFATWSIGFNLELEVITKYTEQPIPRMEAFKMGSHMTDTLLVVVVG